MKKVNKYKIQFIRLKFVIKNKNGQRIESLSHSQIPKIALPKYKAWGYILRWCLQENVPGEFSPLVYILSKRRRRSFSCLQVKVDQKEQTNVFIM
jgi:hypothetical protein